MPLYYFRAPTFDINPVSPTAPRLGSIFSNLNRLTGPLNQYSHEAPEPSTINSKLERKFIDDNHKGTSGSVATLIQGLGGSLGLIFGFKRDTKYIYHCDTLETIEFEPTREFIIRCIQASQDVQQFVDQSAFGRKTVYMITGLKIATRFSRREFKSSESNPQVKIGVYGTQLGYPVGAGVETDFTFRKARMVSSDSDYVVFAYRAIKISPKGDDTSYRNIGSGLYSYGDEDEEEVEWDVKDLDPGRSFPDTISVPVLLDE